MPTTTPSTFVHQTLPNGLTVLAEPDDSAHTAAVGFFVKTGARDETGPLMGVSHFLEHMCFKGTDTRSADDINRAFDDLGVRNNAYTSHEQTVYYAHGLPEVLDETTEVLVDMLRPALREDDFETEKKVILEEIAMYEDRPFWRLQDRLQELFYEGHGLGHRVLGTQQTVSDLSAAAMRGYFDRRYAADQIVVAAAGRFDAAAWMEKLGTLTASWSAAEEHANDATVTANAASEVITDEKLSRTYLGLLWPAPHEADPLRHAAQVYSDVVGDADGSRIYWALVDQGLADEAGMGFQPMRGIGQFMSYATCDPERATEVRDVLYRTIAEAANELTSEELDRAKAKLATLLGLESERPAGRMHRLGDQWLALGTCRPLSEETEALLAVSLDDVKQVASNWSTGPVASVMLGP